MAVDVVDVGDVIRFSVGLLKQLYEEPDHISLLVKVIEVRVELDGSKVLVLQRADER